jgi:putative Mn2+ efflux pump MntP
MRRLSRNSNLRLGIIFAVTELIALGHWAFTATHHLSAQWNLIVGVVLVVLGIPFLVVALRHNSD